jgi:thiamine biosynthesis lipoprotein
MLKNKRIIEVIKQDDGYGVRFEAMASPCEVLIQTSNKHIVKQVGQCVSAEVWRIEDKYSRYNPLSVCSKINSSEGKSFAIDEETLLLLNFAEQCYQLSDGLFDISSGALRKVWTFDSTSAECKDFPNQDRINNVLNYIGWHKVTYDQNSITLLPGMQLDFGGLGKEYAVDRSILLAKKLTDEPLLVNFGGDLAVNGPRHNNQPWQVAIEHPDNHGHKQDMIIAIKKGALATSGDARRFLIRGGIRYGHVMNAITGWPILEAPRSITVAAPHCIQAGILSTLGLLQGKAAEAFLTEQEITYWARR